LTVFLGGFKFNFVVVVNTVIDILWCAKCCGLLYNKK